MPSTVLAQNAVAMASLQTLAASGAAAQPWAQAASVVSQLSSANSLITSAPAAVLWENGKNLMLTGNGTVGYGNSLANSIEGNDLAQVVNGAGGNDLLTGGGGADTFQMLTGGGWDIVTDFQAGLDKIHLARFAGLETASKVLAALQQIGEHVILDLGGGQGLTFLNADRTAFSAKDFELPADPASLKLTFADEFNSFSSSTDGSSGTWRTTYGSGNRTLASNNEQQFYGDATTGTNPFSLRDGALVVTATPGAENELGLPYTSGLINTRESLTQTYGYFEASMKLPAGAGWWPAFWMLPATGTWPPELDIMESFGRQDNRASFTMHVRDGIDSKISSGVDAKIGDLFSGYHSFAVSWLPDEIRWFVDGAEVASMATPREMNVPMYMLLNMAVTAKHTGGSAEMLVDHVRAYQYDAATIAAHADRAELVTSHTDTTLGVNVSNLILSGPGTLRGTGNARGNILQAERTGAAALYGMEGVDSLIGGIGNDTLDGGAGSDVMLGGKGNDTYFVDSSSDQITEYANSGTDTVQASVGYTLSNHVENLVLTSTTAYLGGHGNGLNNRITAAGTGARLNGFAGNDTLVGSAFADNLIGGIGADQMIGGAGNDSYEVDNVKDVVIELANGGTDTIRSSVSYMLGANVENLILTGGTVNLTGTGNGLGNRLTATDMGSRLFGKAGADALVGGKGNDWLDGGTGQDTMSGGMGNDNYVVDDAKDLVVEAANGGTDVVSASVSYTLTVHVERLILTGIANLNGTGNELANLINGNSGANRLNGAGGNDTISGLKGNDTLTGGQGADTFILSPGDGQDVITDFGYGGADRIQLAAHNRVHSVMYTETNGHDTVLHLSTGDSVTLMGVTQIRISGDYILAA